MYFWYYLHIFYFYHEKFIGKNCKNIYFSQKCVHLGKLNFYILQSEIVVHVQMCFSKVHPAGPKIANGIKPGSNSKSTDKHAANCSKAACFGVK